MNCQEFKLDLEKAEEPKSKFPTSVGSSKKLKEFQKNIYFCLFDYAKAFDCVDHNKCGKLFKRWEYQTTSAIVFPVVMYGCESWTIKKAGEFLGQRSLVGYSPWGHTESDQTEGLTLSFTLDTVDQVKMKSCWIRVGREARKDSSLRDLRESMALLAFELLTYERNNSHFKA